MGPAAFPLFPLVLLLAVAASAQEPLRMPVPSEAPPATGPVLTVRVLTDGSALVDGAASDSAAVVVAVRKHAHAHPDGAVGFSSTPGTLYAHYIRVLDAVKAGYLAERDAVALRAFGAPYAGLGAAASQAVSKRVPMRISLAEPE